MKNFEQEIQELRRRLDELANRERLELSPRPRRKGIGKRTHQVTLTDEVMDEIYLEWVGLTSHGDNPSVEDAVILRKMLSKRTGENLEMVCLFWMRNEMVALRKHHETKQEQSLSNGGA